jgi:hypothetical protein
MASLISIGQVIDSSLEHYRKHFRELLAILLWIVVASVPSIVGKILAPIGDNAEAGAGDWISFALSMGGSILSVVVGIWVYAALVLAINNQAEGKKTDLKKISKAGWKVFWPYLGLTIALAAIFVGIALITAPGFALLFISAVRDAAANSSVLAALGAPLFFIGGFISLILLAKYSIQLAFAPFLLLLEGQGIVASIKGSLALVRGRWWGTFFRFVLPKIIYFLLAFVVSLIVFTALEVAMRLLSANSPVLVLLLYTFSLLLSNLLTALLTPLLIGNDFYLYKSLKATR